VRTRKGEDLGSMPLQALIERLKAEVFSKGGAA
jgi:threonyl-tRNA synthetase